MKAITVNVSEPVYADFQRFARERDRNTSELIREAMEEYLERRIRQRTSLANARPLSLGRPLRPALTAEDDLLAEMRGDD